MIILIYPNKPGQINRYAVFLLRPAARIDIAGSERMANRELRIIVITKPCSIMKRAETPINRNEIPARTAEIDPIMNMSLVIIILVNGLILVRESKIFRIKGAFSQSFRSVIVLSPSLLKHPGNIRIASHSCIKHGRKTMFVLCARIGSMLQ